MSVSALPPNESNTVYSHMGRDFGNPMLNIMMSMMFGQNLMPSRDSGQDMYDALMQRQRSQHFLELQRSGAANNMLFKAMGINENPLARMIGSMGMSSPDSAAGKLLAPLLGGNPMAASMQIYGGLAGANIMGNFGRAGSISVGETESTMDALLNNIYKTQDYEGPGGVREEMNQKAQKRLLALAENKKNDTYLKSLGVNVSRESDGSLSEQTKSQIAKFEVAGSSLNQEEMIASRKSKVAGINTDITNLLDATDKDIASALTKRVEQQLKDHGIATEEQINSANSAGDKFGYAAKIKEYLNEYEAEATKSSGSSKSDDSLRQRIDIKRTTASKLASQLEEIQKLDDDDKEQREEKSNKIKAFRKDYAEAMDLAPDHEDINNVFDKDRGIASPDGMTSKGASRAREAIEKYSALDSFEKDHEKAEAYKKAGKKYKGFNFENSMGFKVEDFTSAYVQASNLRALGDSKGVSIAGKMGDFSANAGGALAAARSLFGNKSGGELVSKISDMMGSDLDLSTRPGSDKAEKLLRDVKATADVAGVSINAMLGIIDAASELAANNPRLAGISKKTTTMMALNAVTKAADLGMGMTAKEYREAGGSQNIMSREISEQNEFMASPLNSQIFGIGSAVMGLGDAVDKNGNTYNIGEKYKEMAKSGELARLLKEDNLEAISEMTQGKISVDELARLRVDESAAAFGRENTELSEAVLGGKKTVISENIWEQLKDSGIDKEQIQKDYAEERKKGNKALSIRDFLRAQVTPKISMNTELMGTFKAYEGSLQQDIIDATRTDQEKAEIEKRKQERADTAARLDRTYAANMSPIAQQFLGALMEGKGFEDTSEIVGGIFATRDYSKDATRQAVEKAKSAVDEIGQISKEAKGNDRKAMDLGMDKVLNSFIAGRKADAEDRGERAEHLAANITAEDFKQEADDLRHVAGVSNAKEAREKLEKLEELESKGQLKGDENKVLRNSLRALRTASKAGHLENDKSFNLAREGHIAAATVNSQMLAETERVLEQEKTGSLTRLGTTLEEQAQAPGGEKIQEALDFYSKQLGKSATDPSVIKKLYQDWQNPTQGSAEKNFFKDAKTGKRKTELDGSALGTALQATQEEITTTENKLKVSQEKQSGTDNPLVKAMQDLASKISDGGAIGEALSGLAGALRGMG